MIERDQLVIHFSSNTFVSDIGVNFKCHIKSGSTFGQYFHIPFGCKNHHFCTKEIQLKIIQKLKRIRVWSFKNFTNTFEPIIKLRFPITAPFIFPVSGKSTLCNLVHTLTPNLYLDPLPVWSHKGSM